MVLLPDFMPFLCYFYLICSSTTCNTSTVNHFRTERMLEAAWGARARGRLECGSSYWLEATSRQEAFWLGAWLATSRQEAFWLAAWLATSRQHAAYIAAFLIDRWKMTIKRSSPRHWESTSEFFHCAYSFQRHGAFIAAFPTDRWKMTIKRSSPRHWESTSEFFHCAFANPFTV